MVSADSSQALALSHTCADRLSYLLAECCRSAYGLNNPFFHHLANVSCLQDRCLETAILVDLLLFVDNGPLARFRISRLIFLFFLRNRQSAPQARQIFALYSPPGVVYGKEATPPGVT